MECSDTVPHAGNISVIGKAVLRDFLESLLDRR